MIEHCQKSYKRLDHPIVFCHNFFIWTISNCIVDEFVHNVEFIV